MRISAIEGDITLLKTDAIVNAANNALLGGGGVDGAIHQAAGPGLLEECRLLGGCPTGEARITRGHNLPARWVIHTVGPVWQGGDRGEDELLARCYKSCFYLAEQYDVVSIAFPSISTGTYRFPLERASKIAVREISKALSRIENLHVTVVCFNEKVYRHYVEALEK